MSQHLEIVERLITMAVFIGGVIGAMLRLQKWLTEMRDGMQMLRNELINKIDANEAAAQARSAAESARMASLACQVQGINADVKGVSTDLQTMRVEQAQHAVYIQSQRATDEALRGQLQIITSDIRDLSDRMRELEIGRAAT